MCLWLSRGTEWGYLLEISDPACLCISASDVGDDCRVLYGFHELRYGNPGTGFPEIGGSIQGEAPAVLWALLAAGMAVLAGTWKITVIIPLIACAVILLWQRVSVDRRVTLLFGGFVVILGVALQLWANSYEITKEASETANPVISWVALGMKEDGSWTNNREFVDHMYEFSTRQEKQQ